MSHYFRFEPTNVDGLTPRPLIKVFAKSQMDLPLDIDLENRYGIFSAEGEDCVDQIRDLEVRKDDVWVITMPKSGTTWMLELVWMLTNNLDYEGAMKTEHRERCHWLEYVAINPTMKSIEVANNMKSPRVMKSHLPMHMLPKGLWTVKPKIVYVSRDPKDGIVSYYHFLTGLGMNSKNIDVFVNQALNNENLYGPHWSHVAEFWKLRNEPNIFVTSFERMKKDLRAVVQQVSKHLEKDLSNEQLEELVDHLTFDKMKDNPSCNNVKEVSRVQKSYGIEDKPSGIFIRKGTVGSHKEDLSNDFIEKLNEWTERSLKPFSVTADEILLS